MDTRKALDSSAIALMLVLCLVWGLQQVVLKGIGATAGAKAAIEAAGGALA